MTVAAIWRYPVKSMAGERLTRAEITADGIVGDRAVQVYDRHDRLATARTFPRLLRLSATLGPDGEPRVDGQPWRSPEVAAWVESAVGPGALAGDGVVFENHFCPYPVCTPSRYSLLTGLYARQNLGLNNRCTLPAGVPTLPRLLKSRGYQTAAVGKMHFTPAYLDVGFDRMALAEQDGEGRFYDDYHRDLMAHGLIDDVDLIDQRREFRAHASPEYFGSFGTRESDLPEDMHQLIDDHQFDIRVKARKEAVADLIRRGREAYLAEKKAPESK
jgi:hypothetical protein